MWLREIAIVVIGALVASTLLRLFLVQMFVIPSGSMENTLLVGDRVAVQKVAGFQRGDVVVFRDTQNWLTTQPTNVGPVMKALIFVGLAPDESTNHLIKRVVGVEGDRITCCDAQGRLTVNGVALNESAYLYVDPVTGEQVDPSSMAFDVVVPQGRIFVLGDHRNASQDSRCHLSDETPGEPVGSAAFIRVEDVVGSAIAIAFPFDRLRGLGRADAFDVVGEGQDPPAEAVLNGPQPSC